MYTARLVSKSLISAAADCYHFEFAFDGTAPATLEPGQFLSLVADDAAGKTYTRAYSLASAPRVPAAAFDLCVNRVPGGFFSNLLCDLPEGASLQCHGPHGLFTLRNPPADALLVAAGTGIAPMRGFAQHLFSDISGEPGLSAGRDYWLVYEAPHADELFYDSYFRELAARNANFHYLPVLGHEEDHAHLNETLAGIAPSRPDRPGERHAYVCGLGEMVKAARSQLVELGWQKRQMLFERYD